MTAADEATTGATSAGPMPAAAAAAQVGPGRAGVMTGLTVFAGGSYLCGPAVTCACVPEDNLALHVAIAQAPPGSVIVCDGGGTCRSGLLGELMAADAVARGLAGAVIGGTVRDLGDLDRTGFPVLAAGTAPAQASKAAVVSVGGPVLVGGVLVRPGDQIVADRDGAVVVPAADWPGVLAAVADLSSREENIRQRLAAGERLAGIIGLDLSRFSGSGERGIG